MPTCLRGSKFLLLGISWIQISSVGYFMDPNFFLWVFRGSKFFCRGHFVGSNFFFWVFRGSKFLVVIISCLQISSCEYFMGPNFFFSWVFRGSNFVGPNVFLVSMSISWVQMFFSWVFRGSNFLLVSISWV